jgi:hypothetical protein
MTATATFTQVRFREVKTKTEPVFILNAEGLNANKDRSMALLNDNDFQPLTYQKALVLINQNPELKEQLKGKWFYLAGEGSNMLGLYTFNEKGELIPGPSSNPEKTVRVWPGTNPLSLLVNSGTLDQGDGRYDIDACSRPSCFASVVVGLRASQAETKETGAATADRAALLR